MRTLKQALKQILAFFIFIAVFSGCSAAFAETTESSTKNNVDWPGVYYGFTPCIDCKGIKTTLALNANSSYLLITQHVGKSEREFVEKGKFTAGDKSDTLILTPRKDSSTRQYLVGEDMLIQLDSNSERISGELADRYILRRKSMTEPASHSSH